MKHSACIGVVATFALLCALPCAAQSSGGWSLPNARANQPSSEARAKPKERPTFFDPEGEVKSEYDRFERKTKINLANALVAGEHLNGLYLMAYGERSAHGVGNVYFGFKAITPLAGAYFPEAPKLDAIIDGQVAHFGYLTRLSNEAPLGLLNIEMYGAAIGPELLGRMARAEVIEMRLNKTEFKFESRHHELLRRFVNLLVE